jgi:hypothetical protein
MANDEPIHAWFDMPSPRRWMSTDAIVRHIAAIADGDSRVATLLRQLAQQCELPPPTEPRKELVERMNYALRIHDDALYDESLARLNELRSNAGPNSGPIAPIQGQG